MCLGPVFQLEWITISRRLRYLVLRFVIGLILLGSMVLSYSSYELGAGGGSRAGARPSASRIAEALFREFATTQDYLVFLMTPALVVGVIARDKERRRLDDLLASPLSSAEIVLGKLAARWLYLGSLLAISVPVLSLLSLLGGIDPREVARAYVVSLSLAWFLSGLAILVSTLVDRSRDALAMVYLIVGLWLIVPPILERVLPTAWPAIYRWVGPVSSWVDWSNPISYHEAPVASTRLGIATQSDRFGPMIGLQLAAGFVGSILATALLKPIARGERQGFRRDVGRRRSWSVWRRPPVGESPMLWKEWSVGRSAGLPRLLGRLGLLVVSLFIGYRLWRLSGPAFDEVQTFGYGWVGWMPARIELNGFLRGVMGVAYPCWLILVGAMAATGVSVERERCTWESLRTTLLTGAEVILGKYVGAIRPLWLAALGFVALWTVGLVAGGLHLFGFVALLVEFTVFTGFAAALGTFVSLRARSTAWAIGITLGILVFVSGGYMLLVIPIVPYSPLAAAGCTPLIVNLSTLSYEDLWPMLGTAVVAASGRANGDSSLAATCLLGILLYAIATLILTGVAMAGFDAPPEPSVTWTRPITDEPVEEPELEDAS